MNFYRYYAIEEVDDSLEVYDKYRASFYERIVGIREGVNAAKRRMTTTKYYCKSQGKTYNELIKMK